jgi:cell division protein ZapA (FtsZ GTPase activity inhibitor)
MSEISIKVHIAGRAYPLTIAASDEPRIRAIEKKIEDTIQSFQEAYAVKDKQDLLAMAALQVLALQKAPEKVVETIVETVTVEKEILVDHTDELDHLEASIDQFLYPAES